MRFLTSCVLLLVPVLAQAHGDHALQPHSHGNTLLVVAIVLIGAAIAYPLLRRWLSRKD